MILENRKIPLCVDLDGTLISSDILYESVLLLIRKNILFVFIIPFWVLKGRLHLKNKLFEYVCPNPEFLPYRTEILHFIEQEKFKGRKIILVTASLKKIAERIAEYMIIFDEVIGSDATINLVGQAKRKKLVELYGENGFDYIGDSHKDIFVWKSARNAIVVNPDNEIISQISNISNTFEFKKNIFKLIIKEIRVYQWIKNLLIFVPLLLAHKLLSVDFYLLSYAFLSFSLIASSVYVLNDLIDLESDRSHPRKKNRPFASGNLPIIYAFILLPLLIISSFVISITLLPIGFTVVLIIYYIITTAYSFFLKKLYVMDIITLALLYTIRLLAGAITVDVDISQWFLSFSLFIFFSLAVLKRYTEIMTMKENNKTRTSGRGYIVEDANLLLALGTASGLISVLIFALYLNSPEVNKLYRLPELLSLITPILMYWITRIWFKAHRGLMNDDPMVFAGKDPASYVIGIIIVLIVVGATL